MDYTARIANFRTFSANLAGFADRQEARNVVAVVAPAREAAALATRIANAYENGNADDAKALRAEYVALIAANRMLNSVA